LRAAECSAAVYSRASDSEWGSFYLANKPEALQERYGYLLSRVKNGALRVTVMGSFFRGMQLMTDLLKYERICLPDADGRPARLTFNDKPNNFVLSGFCTDCSQESEARISKHKRVWQYIPEDSRQAIVEHTLALGLEKAIPTFSGKIKSDCFTQGILPLIMNPDVILSATFGQMISRPIFSLPRYGAYNFHPSDLAAGKYPGGNPFDQMIEAGEKTTRMTLHHVDEGEDTGAVVGASPDICVELAQPDQWTRAQHIAALHWKTSQVVGNMALILLSEIKAAGRSVHRIDFSTCFSKGLPDQYLNYLAQPLKINGPEYKIASALVSNDYD
jgi:folate-dependent phosphoribosylglycinamide formyltransferase PurN